MVIFAVAWANPRKVVGNMVAVKVGTRVEPCPAQHWWHKGSLIEREIGKQNYSIGVSSPPPQQNEAEKICDSDLSHRSEV